MKKLMILGSTGSVGTQSISVAQHLGCKVTALTANVNIDLLEEQINLLTPDFAVCADEAAAAELQGRIQNTKTVILSGAEGILRVIREADYDIALNCIVGMAGTRPALEVIKRGKSLALANKECIVTAGALLLPLAKKNGVPVLSMDSEHSAIFQCLQDKAQNKPRRLLLTASGGPFFGKTQNELKNVTAKQALLHPNWLMGAKITIDCATLMNKGLEIIEAVRLFDMPQEKVDVVVHRESIVHSMVEFDDGSVIAQLSVPDMQLPVQYAITYPNRQPSPIKSLNLAQIGNLTFFEADEKTFKAMKLCRQALKTGGTAPAVLNAANEIAVERFLNGQLGFLDIADFVENTLNKTEIISNPSFDEIFEADKKVRLLN